MLNLDKTEYDLNTLFSFEILKEILLKLAKSQINIEEEIKKIKNTTLKHDKIILKLEEEIGEGSDLSNYEEEDEENSNSNITEQNENKENNLNESYDNKNNREEEEKELIKEGENITKIESPKNKKENININIMEENEQQENKNDDKNINEHEQKKLTRKKRYKTHKVKDNKESPEQDPNGGTYVSPELFSKVMKQLKEHTIKLSILDKKLKKESKNIKNIDKNFDNHVLNSKNELTQLKDKINSLFEKNTDYDQKFEDLQVKISEFNIYNMFKDSGDGTIDFTKVMVKSLEEKVFKKFDLIDQRNKKESLDNYKIKTNVENIMPKLDQFQREIQKINEMENKRQEELENYKKENENLKNDTENNFNMRQNFDDIKEELEKIMNDKMLVIENKIKEIKNKNEGNYGDYDILKLGLGNHDINKETIEALDKKINDLRKKINDIENTLKIFMSNNETDNINKELKDLKLIINKKITKDDLKELYNFHLNTKDEINDLRNLEESSFDELRKTIRDLQNLQQRVESINGNLSLLQNSPKTSGGIIVDFTKYVEQQKLNETIKPILKELEKIYRELESLKRELTKDEEENDQNLKTAISKLDEDLNGKVKELKILVQKRYLEKLEFNKTIKNLEVQIKVLGEDGKKEGDSWLLAKRPLKCFNCASCESKIRNDYSTADYLPWKKYPRGEKIHRMGQGFSHMLQMMTSEFIKSLEENDNLKNNNNNNNSNTHNVSTQFNDKSNVGLIINSREDSIKNLKGLSKMRLPKVKQNSNPKINLKKSDESLPISDDEKDYFDDINYEKDLKKISKNPKILKITRLDKSNAEKRSMKDIFDSETTLYNNQIESIIGKSGRNEIFLKTEKNTFNNTNIRKFYK